ncbi:hypothetical protein M3Y97_01016100 [Aphelenchoides bicaudatus]|nr:hypothetical protein M3Y97_01016100 [Aphelenchoides bicaudatus]
MNSLFDAIARPQHDPSKPGPIKPKWIFTDEELRRSPSVMSGMPFSEEQRLIRYGGTFIRKIADRLNDYQKEMTKITQLCVSVSIIQLRRFFAIQTLKDFDARDVGAAILFMTTKSEECPRRLEYIVRTWYKVRYDFDNKDTNPDDKVVINKEAYDKFCEYIVWLENIVLQTIGFNFGSEVPHPHVLSLSTEFRHGDKKFQEVVFWLVTDVLHLTNWSLRFKASKIAVVCFYMAIIWKDEAPKLPQNDAKGNPWYYKLDPSIKLEEMQELTREFLQIWKDVDKSVNLSMSQFDHKAMPVIMDLISNPNNAPWNF